MKALAEIAGAAGLSDPSDFLPYHFMFRSRPGAFEDGNEAYPYLPEGFLITGEDREGLASWHDRWSRASAASFTPPVVYTGPYRKMNKAAS